MNSTISVADKASGFAHEQVAQAKDKAEQTKWKGKQLADMIRRDGFDLPVAGQLSISRLQSYVIAFVVIGVAGSVGLSIMSGVGDSINDTEAQTGVTNAIDGMNELLGWLPIIGLVVAAAVVLSLVSNFRGGGSRMRA